MRRFPDVEETCRNYRCDLSAPSDGQAGDTHDQQPEALFSVSPRKLRSLGLDRTPGENESAALYGCIVQHLIPQGYLTFGLPPSRKA